MAKFSKYVIMRIQNMAIGLNLYLGSQSICIVGFGFPTMGCPMLGHLSTLLFPPNLFSLPHKVTSSLSQNSCSSPSLFFLELPTPNFSSLFLIYSVRSMGVP